MPVSNILIKVGTNVFNDPHEKKLSVSHIAKHPSHKGGIQKDIALIRLKASIKFTSLIRPICLPNKLLTSQKLMSYRHCVLSGFGYIDRGS